MVPLHLTLEAGLRRDSRQNPILAEQSDYVLYNELAIIFPGFRDYIASLLSNDSTSDLCETSVIGDKPL